VLYHLRSNSLRLLIRRESLLRLSAAAPDEDAAVILQVARSSIESLESPYLGLSDQTSRYCVTVYSAGICTYLHRLQLDVSLSQGLRSQARMLLERSLALLRRVSPGFRLAHGLLQRFTSSSSSAALSSSSSSNPSRTTNGDGGGGTGPADGQDSALVRMVTHGSGTQGHGELAAHPVSHLPNLAMMSDTVAFPLQVGDNAGYMDWAATSW